MDHRDLRGLRTIVVLQSVGAALALVPLLYFAALTFTKRAFATPELAFGTIWTVAAIMTALFNFFGGVALYYNPRRRLILGLLAVSALLLLLMVFL
jgi:hypothetical protein